MKGLEVVEWQPTAPLDDVGEPLKRRRTDEPSQLDRIEAKLDALLQALAEDEDQPATESLDGTQVPKPGQELRSL